MNIDKYIVRLCKQAKMAASYAGSYTSIEKNNLLKSISQNIQISSQDIIKANSRDIVNAQKKGLDDSMIDRLLINADRINLMSDGLKKISKIKDTLYKTTKGVKQKSGIVVSQMRVPLGVIGMIYESRPNVTIDAAGLCIKSGNSVILRGGSESINTNKILMLQIQKALNSNNFQPHMVQLVNTIDRKAVTSLLSMNKYIDVIIPRGGKGLVEKVISCSSIPMIKHLDGNCHVYIDRYANSDAALDIVINSKTQRYGVCNAMETLIVHKKFSKVLFKKILGILVKMGVKIKGCKETRKIFPEALVAEEDDWFQEYLAPIISVKIVGTIDEAINHIDRYGSMHTDAIVSANKTSIEKFKKFVNSSSVMINTSTRFADGFEYGLGAEIGISTDKLHARGPVGLDGLTNLKYIVNSSGKIRD